MDALTDLRIRRLQTLAGCTKANFYPLTVAVKKTGKRTDSVKEVAIPPPTPNSECWGPPSSRGCEGLDIRRCPAESPASSLCCGRDSTDVFPMAAPVL